MAVVLPDTELLERTAELEALEAAFAGVSQSGGRLVLVAGEAGVGKTVLLRRFAGRSGPPLWGDCDALFTLSPLGPLVDIAATTGGELAERIAEGAPPHVVAAALLQELATREHGSVVVFEDVHWADEATLDVLRVLSRRIATAPALLIASYRDDELDAAHPLRVGLGELLRHDSTSRLRLAPLSEQAVAALAAPHGVDPDELYRRTAGNPFFVTEALAAGAVELPETIRDAVLARVAPLSPPARRLLEAAAIVPGTLEPALLAALAQDDMAHLSECLSCGVLGATDTALAFRHELARVAVDETLPPDRRQALHRTALAALEGNADAARLAYHAEGAGNAEAVLRYAPAAAERAGAAGAHREAAAQYARALRFAGALTPAERAELHELRSQQCYTTDLPAEAVEDLRHALTYHRELGDQRREGDALRALSSILWCPGQPDEAEATGRDAVALLEPLGPSRELAMAYANMASLAMNYEDVAGTREWGRRAIDLARTLGDEAIEIHALNSIGTVDFLVDGPDARGTGELSIHRALEADLIEDALRAWSNLIWAAMRHRALPLAADYLRTAIEYATDTDRDLWWNHLLGYRARLELDAGRWDDATETATLILRRRRASTLPVMAALSVLGRLRARRGDPDPWGPLDEALTLAGPELQRLEPVAVARVEAAWLIGDHERAIAEIERIEPVARRAGDGWVLGELACWRRRAGAEADPGREVAEPHALELAGRHADAAAAWTALGCPYEAAIARAGADDEAAQRQAIDELHALGAAGAANVLARDLRRRGAANVPRGPRPSTRENPAQLTARELEVLGLLADGLRNREIAERLFVSTKTAAHHVAAIMSKLDARSRGEAVAQALRDGLIEPR